MLFVTNNPNPRQSNYVKEFIDMVENGEMLTKPGLYKHDVYHDDWCNFFKNGICNCNPEIVTTEIKP